MHSCAGLCKRIPSTFTYASTYGDGSRKMPRKSGAPSFYTPQTITVELIRKASKRKAPESPKEIRDRAHGLILRHQPSGYLSLYVELGRGKRERLCNARDVIAPNTTLT